MTKFFKISISSIISLSVNRSSDVFGISFIAIYSEVSIFCAKKTLPKDPTPKSFLILYFVSGISFISLMKRRFEN